MKKHLLILLAALSFGTANSQTKVYEHNFEGTLTAPNFTVGNNLSLTSDRVGNANSAVFLPTNHTGLLLDFSNNTSLKSLGSVSFWYKQTSTLSLGINANHPIFYMNNGSSDYYEGISLAYSSVYQTLTFGSSDSNSNTNIAPITVSNLNVNTWNYYSITYSNSTANLYVNNTLVATKTLYSMANNVNNKMCFGSYIPGTGTTIVASVSGSYDQIAVFDNVLTQQQVINNSQTPIDYNDTLFQHLFTNTLTSPYFSLPSSSYLVHDKFGNANSAANLPNTDDVIELDYGSQNNVLKNQGTISFWFRYTNVKLANKLGENSPFFYVQNGAASYHEGICLGVNLANNYLRFGSSNPSNSTSNANIDTNFRIYISDWNYYTISYSPTSMSLYVNGVLVVSRIFNPLLNESRLKRMQFGGWKSSTTLTDNPKQSLIGDFDNIRVYNKKFTDEQASQLYAKEIANQGNLNLNELVAQNSEIKVYPNPVQNIITITSTNDVKTIKAYNTLGQLQNIRLNNNQADVSELASGVYILHIELDNNIINKVKVIKK